MEKCGDISAAFVVGELYSMSACTMVWVKGQQGETNITRHKVESSRVKLERLGKIRDTHSKVTKLMHRSRSYCAG